MTTKNNFDFSTWEPRNQDWVRQFAVALVGQDGATNENVHEILERTRRFSNDSEQSAQAMMGDPRRAAKAAFTDIDTSEAKANNRVETTFGAFCTGMLSALIETFAVSLFWIRGWSYEKTSNLLFVFTISAILLCFGLVAFNFFKRGMMRACLVVALAGVVAFAGATIGLGSWVGGTSFTYPALGVFGIEIFLIILFGWLCFSERFLHSMPVDGRDWFTQFEGVLRGQHLLSKAEAREHVAEARAHLAATGTNPFEEFGAPATYAEQLVGESTGAILRSSKTTLGLRWFQFLCFITLAFIFISTSGWALWAIVVALVVVALNAWNLWTNTKKERNYHQMRLEEAQTDDF